MAKKKSNSKNEKKNTGGKNTGKRNAKAEKQGLSGRVKAIICFALALVLACILILPFGLVWGTVRSFLYGVFGICVFELVALLAVLAYRYEKGLKEKLFTPRFWCVMVSMVLFQSIVHIIYILVENIDGFSEGITAAYSTFWQGVIGAVVGGAFVLLIGKIGSLIILLIVLIALIFIVSGLTLSQAAAPFKKIFSRSKKKDADGEPENTVANRGEEKEKGEDRERKKNPDSRTRKGGKGFNFDVDIDDDGESVDWFGEIPGNDGKTGREDTADDSGLNDAPIYYFDDFEKEINRQNEDAHNEGARNEGTDTETGGEGESDYADDVPPPDMENVYRYPPINLLQDGESGNSGNVSEELKKGGEKLIETLGNFGVSARIVAITRGPAVTRYEISPAPGVKISHITTLADDIAMNLAASGVRIEAPIPNKAAVGIEIPNKSVTMVKIKELIDSNDFKDAKSKLTVSLGRDIEGNPICADLAKMPHILIAGATGSGKSVCINSMIISLLYKATPDEVKFIMIDPKVVELSNYNGIPHLLVPVVSEPNKASGALKWAVQEMEKRYRKFAETGVRDIKSFNAHCEKTGEEKEMPQIVIIIDELADLMMVARNEVEDSICRLAQKARAAGMHLVLATQRPSVNVITGVIKANIPSRIALAVSSQVDSRTILDMSGAEKLLGNGDMLFAPIGMSKPKRVQGCFVSDEEIESVIKFTKAESETNYSEEIDSEIERLATVEKNGKGGAEGEVSDRDVLFIQAADLVIHNREASTTFLQRKLNIGYARAARIMDQLCEAGLIGPSNGSKPREILVSQSEWMEMKALGQDE